MFIGLVVVIMIISISVLAIINSYFLAFSDNFGDLNDYYSSQYAAVSAMERGWSRYQIDHSDNYGDNLFGGGLEGDWNGKWNIDDSTSNEITIISTGTMREFTNTLTTTILQNTSTP